MTATISGELSADARHIVVHANGAEHEVAEAARYLQTLTPLLEHLCRCGHLLTAHTDDGGGHRGACRACVCLLYAGTALQMPVTWAAVVQLSATFGRFWAPGPRLAQWTAGQFVDRTAIDPDTHNDVELHSPARLAIAPPRGLEPRPYQVAAARMIGTVGSCILGDDPGTGKTPSAILGLIERAAAGHAVLPIVVVCPNAVVDSWVSHFRDWAPFWRVVPWSGSPGRRKRRIGTADIYVATYGVCRSDAGSADARELAKGRSPLIGLGPRALIIDEAHKISDPSSSQSRAVRKIAARVAQLDGITIPMSGTLIRQTQKDLWASLYAIAPHAFPSSERWIDRYCDSLPGDYGAPTVIGLRENREPEFRDTILGQFRRVAKADVLDFLPPKVYSVRTVDIPERWRKVYDDVEAQMLAELPAVDDTGEPVELEVWGVLAQLTRLLQIASAAADVTVTEETVVDEYGVELIRKHQHVTLKAPSWKVDAALEVMSERPGTRFVAAAPSKQLMMLMGQAAAAAGYRVAYLVGGQSATTRTEQIDGFQRGDFDLICVTTGAGGVGVTLTAASCLIFLQRPWSYVDAVQMEDRAHRLGSERHSSIEIIDIVTAKTIETRVRALLKGKAQQLSDFVEDPRIVAELLGGDEVRDLRKAPKARAAA